MPRPYDIWSVLNYQDYVTLWLHQCFYCEALIGPRKPRERGYCDDCGMPFYDPINRIVPKEGLVTIKKTEKENRGW
ncbi:hypothetical protein L204_101188 [Cryptococcus depauperatus]